MSTRFALAASLLAGLAGGPTSPRPGFVVHEWGTFTSMHGSDGVALEGLQHEEEELPPFVYSRSEVRECPLRDRGYKGLEVDVARVTRKMETPVLYFYSDTPLRARVRVDFERGLLTQWYPVVDRLGPPEKALGGGPLDLSRVERSFLEWRFDVLPRGEGRGAIPSVPAGDPWAFQRLPDSNLVRTLPRESPRMGPVETEEFLFYRGLGTFDLPLTATTGEQGRLVLTNSGDEDIEGLFVLHVRDGRGQFLALERVAAGGTAETRQPLAPDAPSVEAMVADLVPLLVERLVARGLFPAEAEAMARTWERSYFHSEGLRVLYLVPDGLTNRLLPIEIEPVPSGLVRVLVGRLECITPELEAEVEGALRNRASTDAQAAEAARATLDRLGRFLEPHVRRALARTGDETVRRSAREVLAGL